MIIESGRLRILADTIAAVLTSGEESTVYTTGGAIPCSRADAEYIGAIWKRWNEEIQEREEIEEEEEEDEEEDE